MKEKILSSIHSAVASKVVANFLNLVKVKPLVFFEVT